MTSINPINFDPESTLGKIQDSDYDLRQQRENIKAMFTRAAPVAEREALNFMRGIAQRVIEKVSEPGFASALEKAHQNEVREKFCEQFNKSVLGSYSSIPTPLRSEDGVLMQAGTYMYSYLLHAGTAKLKSQIERLADGDPARALSEFKQGLSNELERAVFNAAQDLRNINLDPHMDVFDRAKYPQLSETSRIPIALGRALGVKQHSTPIPSRFNSSSAQAFTFSFDVLRSVEQKIAEGLGMTGLTGNFGCIDSPLSRQTILRQLSPFLGKKEKNEGPKPGP